MNQLKKTIAALTALICVCSAAAFPVSASDNIDFPSMETINDYVGYPEYGGGMEEREVSTMSYFIVETDGTEMMTVDVPYLTKLAASEITDEDIAGCYGGLEYHADSLYYEVHLDSLEHMTAVARNLWLENDSIRNIYFIRKDNRTGVDGPWGLSIYPKDENAQLEVRDFPDFNALTKSNEDAVWYAGLSPELRELRELTCTTDYEDYLFMSGLAEQLMAEYGDVFDHIELEWSGKEGSSSYFYMTQTAWATAGDPNADGTVTAEDAADLLITAAEAGAGAVIAATAAADVNADGTVGADDAAAVLCYAAAQGSGNPLSWLDILRK